MWLSASWMASALMVIGVSAWYPDNNKHLLDVFASPPSVTGLRKENLYHIPFYMCFSQTILTQPWFVFIVNSSLKWWNMQQLRCILFAVEVALCFKMMHVTLCNSEQKLTTILCCIYKKFNFWIWCRKVIVILRVMLAFIRNKLKM